MSSFDFLPVVRQVTWICEDLRLKRCNGVEYASSKRFSKCHEFCFLHTAKNKLLQYIRNQKSRHQESFQKLLNNYTGINN